MAHYCVLIVLGALSSCSMGGINFAHRPIKAMEQGLSEHYAKTDKDGLLLFRKAYDEHMRKALVAEGVDAKKREFDAAKLARDKVIGDLLIIGEAHHQAMDETLHWARAGSGLVLDFVQIVTAAWATVAPAESTSKVLAAISGGTKSFQTSVDKRVFFEQATAALLSIMKKERTLLEKNIRVNMLKSVKQYPLELALIDGAQFIAAGSLTDAIAKLGIKAGQSAAAAEADAKAQLEREKELREKRDKLEGLAPEKKDGDDPKKDAG